MTDHTWQNHFPNFSCSCGKWQERAGGPDEERYSGFGYRQWENHVKETIKAENTHILRHDGFLAWTCACGRWNTVPDVPHLPYPEVAAHAARREWAKHLEQEYLTAEPVLDPVEVAVELLSEALPGFRTKIKPHTGSVRMEGALPIAQEFNQDWLVWPIRGAHSLREPQDPVSDALRDVVEMPHQRAQRFAKRRLRVEEDISDQIRALVSRIQDFAIDAVSLQPEIDRRVAEAEKRAHEKGRAEGKEDGIREGRRLATEEFIEAQRDVSLRLAQATGEIPDIGGNDDDDL